MPPLATQARTVARGEKNPHVAFEDPLENRAWAVWHAVRNGKAKTSGRPGKGPDGRGLGAVDGFTVEVNLTTKMRDLWAQLSQLDQQTRNNFISEVRQFLTRSGNAVCTRLPGVGTGDHGQPEWWIRDEWLDVKGIPIWKQTELTNTEKRLTPQEAGEDRDPSPVTVTKREAQVAVAEESADAAAEGLPDRAAQIIEILKSAKEPMYQSELTHALKIHTQEVGRTLRLLRASEMIATRVEATAERPVDLNGRYRYLYWLTSPVPPRVTPLVTNSQLDRINVLKEGEDLSTASFSPATRKQVDQWVEEGLLRYINRGTGSERVALATGEPEAAKVPAPAATPAKVGPRPAPAPDRKPAPVIPPVAPAWTPPPVTAKDTPAAPTPDELAEAKIKVDTDVAQIAESIEKLVQQRTIEQMRALLEKSQKDSELVAEYKGRAERAETALIEARAELSEEKKRLTKVREAFGL